MSNKKPAATADLQFPFGNGVLPGPMEVAAYAAQADAVMNQRRFEELGRPCLVIRFHCGQGKGFDRLAYCLTDIPASHPVRVCGRSPGDCRQIEVGFRVGMVEEWFQPAVAIVADVYPAKCWVFDQTDLLPTVHMWDWSLSNDSLIERYVDFDGNRSKTPVFRQLHVKEPKRKAVKPTAPAVPSGMASDGRIAGEG